jgi:hypothetical protein
MALPSSNPRNKITTGLNSGPQINIADYSANPQAITGAFSQGIDLGNKIQDTLALRPKQLRAARAEADASTEKSLTSQDASKADRSLIPLKRDAESGLIPLRAKEEGSGLTAKNTKNETDQIINSVTKAASESDDFKASLTKLLKDHESAAAANAGTTKTLEISREKNAPKEADTNAANTDTANAKANIDNAVINSDANKDAIFDAQSSAIQGAAGKSKVENAPFTDAPVLGAMVEGSKAAGVNQGLTQKIGLAQTMINANGGNGQLSPETRQKLLEKASEKGVPIVDQSGVARPFADVSRDYNQKLNVEQASKVLDGVRAESQVAMNRLQSYKAIDAILGGSVSTGGIRALPGTEIIDNVMAGFGSQNAIANQQLESFRNTLVLDVTGGKLGGQVSNSDVMLIKNSLPGRNQSPAVNKQLVVAGILTNQRGAQKNDFYNELTPSIGGSATDKLWSQYVDANPILDAAASTPGSLQFNRTAMTPNEFLQAIKNPAQAKQSMAQKIQDPSSLPLENPKNPSNNPFVIDPKSNQLKANPVYWTPIEDAHTKFSPAPQANSNDAAARIQNVVNTPTDILLRPRQ